MGTFVLVAGAWHGGWVWERVAGPLRERGHRVSTPELAGVGERAGELTPRVGLATHVDEVCAVLAEQGQGQDEVVLVGHSYGGLVVWGAADRMPDAVAHLVLVDGWIADDGESLLSVVPQPLAQAMLGLAQRGDGVGVPAPGPENFGVTDPADAAWLVDRMTPHPLRTFTDPAQLTGAVDRVPGTALVCRPGNGAPFDQVAKEHGLPVVELASGHNVMVTAPDQVVRELLRVVSAAAVGPVARDRG
ncbi:alpha/beta fold hydrolase [Goodfellowiella coeruleoviolacea]|uniref:Alpha/beta hydrolase family protein n=1 Tax=Goodfellowiella coeruleoviolacea TaxID=334858 RepID=A0AAE3GIM5_9PSEU|nr:alpha/beta fold hydrolase [Goodfellowiella coeruleoviolacea]MCP2168044.1 Alpha/beta hydrolase family protein [Goodfellowiella coeruleoviolacea]